MIQVLEPGNINGDIYIHTYMGAVRITAIATTEAAANAHMIATPGASVIAVHGPMVFMADKDDEGIKLNR